ncbi:Tn3 family transposase [Streptomyces sp. NPDC058239]|uniref:Tn3 family transposase n=1 Tax=Streptomyces sp. NPDC058239 TaxID=3346395 RepID=UPI0036E79462
MSARRAPGAAGSGRSRLLVLALVALAGRVRRGLVHVLSGVTSTSGRTARVLPLRSTSYTLIGIAVSGARPEHHEEEQVRRQASVTAAALVAGPVAPQHVDPALIDCFQQELEGHYRAEPEDQVGALGLVLNALVLSNTRCMDAAVNQLRADGFDVRDEDGARLSPFVLHHINMPGRYPFHLPDLPGGMRPLRDKDAIDEE